ncbi:MAG: GNAT family N-acetyltransferase [Candidatus Andersenbacteria bacterium]|nr:GNAT family N-acetyltransferase [Candidatus Andersenbacteria bacterium]
MSTPDKSVALRGIEQRDVDLCCGWLNSQEIRQHIRVWLPVSQLKEKAFIESILIQQLPPRDIVFIILHQDKPVGMVGVHGIQWDWGCGVLGICIGKQDHRRQKVGSTAYQLLMKYVFEETPLRLLEAEVYATNEGSLRLHKSLGFISVGTSEPKALIGGEHVPISTFSMTREHWRTNLHHS